MISKKLDFLDFNRINLLLEQFNELTGYVTAILDLNGTILSQSGWRAICTEFHRKNPMTAVRCTTSDTILANSMLEGEHFSYYQCLNGLVDVVVPIIIDGEHIANLFSGQFFIDKPDISFFKEQARECGFEEAPYLAAIEEVPVVTLEEVSIAMNFLQNMTQMISEITYGQYKQHELHIENQEADTRYRTYIDNAPLGVFLTNSAADFLEANAEVCRISGFTRSELLDMNFLDRVLEDHVQGANTFFDSNSRYKNSNSEVVIKIKGAERRWWNVITSRLDDDRYLCFVTDITEKKIADEELLESHRRQAFLAQTAIEIVRLTTFEEVYHFSVTKLYEFLEERGVVSFIGYSDSGQRWEVLELIGIEGCESALDELLNFDYHAITGSISEEYKELRDSGRLFEFSLDYRKHLNERITNETGDRLKELLCIDKMYGISFKQGDKLLGNLTFITKKDTRPIDTNTIEAFVSQVSNFLKRLRSELALKDNEKKMRSIYQLVQVGIGIVDGDRVLKEVNPRVCEISGYTREELINAPARMLYPSDEAYLFTAGKTYQEICKYSPGETEATWMRPDGTRVEILLSAAPLENGVPSKGFIFTVLDITERKRGERLLASSEKSLREAQHIAHLGNWEIDLLTQEFRGSQEVYEIYGMVPPENQVMEFSFEDFIFEDPRIKESYEALINDHIPYSLEHTITPKDGSEKRFISSKARIITDNEGRPIKIQGVLQDLSELKAAEEEQKHLKDQLVQAQKMESVGRLAGGVAHDFNNMLSVIIGYADMAMSNIDEEDPFYVPLHEIYKAAERSAELTSQLLAFARKQTITPKAIDLNTSIEDLLNMLSRLIGEDIDLQWIPGKAIMPVLIDPSQIHQVLTNLCINARDAITESGVIIITTESLYLDERYDALLGEGEPGEYVVLTVTDNGSGMDEDTKDHLFEPFFTTKERSKGTGLGFSMIYGIVKQNKGFISVDSELDRGTTIKIHLPRLEDSPKLEATRKVPKELEMGKETILLVEDEKAILSLTSSILEGLGYQVITCEDPQDALKTAFEYPEGIDLLITDVIMPKLNGREVVDMLLPFYPGLSYLYMSGYTADIISDQGILDEDANFIQKPFTPKRLAQKVRSILSKTQ